MQNWSIVSLVILVLLIILGIAAVIYIYKRPEKRKPDYHAFFVMGIVWLIIGIPLKMWGLSAIGLVFTIVGLANKKKWKENRKCWSDLTDKEKKFKMIIVIALGVLVLIGLAIYFLTEKGIINL